VLRHTAEFACARKGRARALAHVVPYRAIMGLSPGVQVSRWRIERELGSGGFGMVWGASDVETGEWVAIKTVLSASPGSNEHTARFRREASNLRRVESDYVGRLIGFLEEPEHGMLMVMEFIEGELLSEILAQTTLSTVEALELGMHITRGLSDMHQVGVIHRDIKPSNIMVRPLESGLQRAVIFDLGLSRFNSPEGTASENSSTDITATASRIAIGTPGYMAPEQVLDARRATAASDVYAAGVVLYRAGCGRLPFDGDERMMAHSKLTADPPAFDAGRYDEVSVRYGQIVNKAIQRRPADRYQSAAQLLRALTELREFAMVGQRAASTEAHPADDFPSSQMPAPALVDFQRPSSEMRAVANGDNAAPATWRSYLVVALLGAALMIAVLWMVGKLPNF
jgi:eukaryotic-like serine/threonine-protein kinase